jgi:hypothetical protein
MVDLDGLRAIPASMGPKTAQPLSGTPEDIAEAMRALRARGQPSSDLSAPELGRKLRSFEPVLRLRWRLIQLTDETV